MKCLYTEGDITKTGSQLVAVSINDKGEPITPRDSDFFKAFPEAVNALQSMFKGTDNLNVSNDMPMLGDVVWVSQGGNRELGFCLVKRKDESELNLKAVELCMKSLEKKALEINTFVVAMDLFGSNNSEDWNKVVNCIENNIINSQVIVCILRNNQLMEVLESLHGGSKFQIFRPERDYN